MYVRLSQILFARNSVCNIDRKLIMETHISTINIWTSTDIQSHTFIYLDNIAILGEEEVSGLVNQ
jgi:hypothetical protein